MRSRNHYGSGTAISITNLSVSAASVIQQAKRMLRIILSGLLLGPTIFFHINKRHDFGRKKNTEQKCVFLYSLQLLS